MTQRYMNRFKQLQSLSNSFQNAVKRNEMNKNPRIYKKPARQPQSDILKARAKLRKKQFQIKDCQQLIDNLVETLSDGTLTPSSDEFPLICSIIKKTLSKQGQTSDKRISSRLLGLLQQASKKQLVDFVSQPGSKLIDKTTIQHHSLLRHRPYPQMYSSYMNFNSRMNQPLQLAYMMKPSQNIDLLRENYTTEEINIEEMKQHLAQGGIRVTRLSERALKQFDLEHGEPRPFGGH